MFLMISAALIRLSSVLHGFVVLCCASDATHCSALAALIVLFYSGAFGGGGGYKLVSYKSHTEKSVLKLSVVKLVW